MANTSPFLSSSVSILSLKSTLAVSEAADSFTVSVNVGAGKYKFMAHEDGKGKRS